MTTINPHPTEEFYDVPSWYEKPKVPKGQVGFGKIPPRRIPPRHRSDPAGTPIVEGRRTLAGVGTLVMLVIIVVLLTSMLMPTLLNSGLAFFGLY